MWWLAMMTLGSIPVIGGFCVAIVTNLLVLLQAVLVGGFLRRHADELGYDDGSADPVDSGGASGYHEE